MSFNVTPKCFLRVLIAIFSIWLITPVDAIKAAAKHDAGKGFIPYWWYPAEAPADAAPAGWYGKSPLRTTAGTASAGAYFAPGPIFSSGTSHQDIRPILCVLCIITAPGDAHDGDQNTASTITAPLNIGGQVGQRIFFPGTYEAGDSLVVDFEVPGTILNASVLGGVQVAVFNGTNPTPVITVPLNSPLANVQLLGIGATNKRRAIIAIPGQFDRVEVTFGAVLNALSSLMIYEVTAFAPLTITPAGNPVVSPAGSSAILTANTRLGAATYRWYDAPVGGSLLSTGATFTTPVLNRGVAKYYAEATTTSNGITSYLRTGVTVDVGGGPGLLWTYGDNQVSPIITGVCALCTVTDPLNAADANPNTSSLMSVPVGALSTLAQRIQFPGVYQAGDSIILDLEMPGQLLSATLLGNITIQPYSGTTAAGSPVVLSNVANIQALGIGVGTTPKFRVSIPATAAFDGVEVRLATTVGGLSALRIYEAAAAIPVTVTPSPAVTPFNTAVNLNAAVRPAGSTFRWYTTPVGGTPVFTGPAFTTPQLTRSTTYYVEAATPAGLTSYTRTTIPVRVGGAAGPLWSHGDTETSPVLSGICLGCNVQNPALAIDQDTTTASNINIPVGVLSTAGQLIRFPGNYQALDSIILDLAIPTGQLLSANVLSGIRIETFQGTTANNDAASFSQALANLQLLGIPLGTNGKFRIAFAATQPFDAVQVSLAPVVGGLSNLQVFEATAVVPVTVNPAVQTVPLNTTASITAGNRLSGATFNWYNTPTGGTPLFTGSTFTTPPMSRATTYYVEAATADGKRSYTRAAATVNVGGGPGPLWTYGDRQDGALISGICLGCTVTNAAAAVDQDTTTSSLINMTLGALGSVSQIIHFPGTYQAGDSIALDLELPNQLFSLQALGGINVQTYTGNTPNGDAGTLNGGLVRLEPLGIGAGSTGKFRVTFPVNTTFDGVSVGTGAALAGLSGLRLYEAVAFMPVTVTPPAPVIPSGTAASMTASVRAPNATYTWYNAPTGGTALATTANFTTPVLTRSNEYYVAASTPDGKTSFVRTAVPVTVSGGPGPLWTYGDNQQSPIIGGICVGCTVNNPALAVDGDTTTASQAVITIGALGSAGQLIKFPGTYQAGDSIAFTLGVPSQLLSAQLLSGIRVQTYNGAAPNNDAINLNNGLVDLQALGLDVTGSVSKFRVTIPVNSTFDGAQVDLTGVVSGLSSLNIYEAAAFIPVTVTPSPVSVPFGNDTTLTATIRLPNATFTWYNQPTGGTPLATGAVFNTPVLTRDVTYYVAASTPDGLTSYVRTSVPVAVLVGPSSPDLSCGRGITQTGGTTGLCLLCAISDSSLAVDDNPQTSSSINVPVGLLGAAAYQRFAFGNESAPGDSLRIVVGSTTGLLNLSLLGNVTVRPRNNGVENAADVRALNNGLLHVQLLDGGTRQVVSFAPSAVFDEVEIRVGGIATALTEINVFYVQQITPVPTVADDTVNVCSGSTAVLTANGPAGATFNWYDVPSGGTPLFTGPSYTIPSVTANAVYFVEAVSGATGCAAEVRQAVFVNVGLPEVTVTASSVTIPQGGTATFNVNTPDPLLTYRWYTTPTGGAPVFEGPAFTTPALNQTTTYYVEASSPAGCVSAQRIAVVANVIPTNPDVPCDVASAQSSNVNGICLGCYVENQPSAVDVSTTTFSTIHTIAGLLGGYAQQTLIWPSSSDALDSIRLLISIPGSLADVGLLNTIQIATYNGSVYNNDRVALNNALIRLSLLGGGSQALITFAPTAVFDRVEVRLNAGVVTALSAVNVHYAQRFVPIPDVVPDTVNTCAGSTATMNVTPRPNTIFRWYSTATGGTPLFTGTTFQSGAITTDSIFYVEAVKTNINCANPVRTPAYVMVSAAPGAPDVADSVVVTCSGTTALLSATGPAGATFNWYTQQSGGTPVFIGASFTTPVLDSSAIYYVEAVSSGGCAGTARTSVQVNVTARPGTPDITPQSPAICSGNAATITASSATPGVTFLWYSTAALDSLIFTGPVFTTPVLTTTATYFVVAANGQCISAQPRVVTVNVTPLLNSPAVSVNPLSRIIEYGQNATITVTEDPASATFRWFTDATGGVPIFTGQVYTTPALANTTTYYVEAYTPAGCAGTRTPVTITVNRNFNPGCDFANAQTNTTFGVCLLCNVANPDNAIDSDTTNFTNIQVPVNLAGGVAYRMDFGSLAAAGDTVKLRFATPGGLLDVAALSNITITSFNGATSNNDTRALNSAALRLVLLGGANDQVALFAPGSDYTSIEVRIGGLLGALQNVNVYYANRILSAPTLTASTNDICANDPVVLTATASDSATVRWYTTLAGGTPVFTGKVFTVNGLTTTTTYYAESYRASTDCVNPLRTAITVNVRPVPDAPVIVKGDTAICVGDSAILMARTLDAISTIRWYTSPAGGVPVSLDSVFVTGALSANTVYYAEAFNGICGSATRTAVNVTVGSAAGDPVLESDNLTICSGNTATLRVVSATTGLTIRWFTVQSGGTPVFTGPEFTTPVLNTTQIYYVEAAGSGGACTNAGGRIAATVNVNATPPVPVLADSVVTICGNQRATLAVENPQPNVTYNWYSAASGGTLLFTGQTFTTPVLTDTATYFVEATAGGTCTSPTRATAAVSVQAALAPPTVESGNVTVCNGQQATLRILNPLGGVTYNWYDAPGGTRLFTGNVFTTGSLVVADTFYVEAVAGSGCISTALTQVNVSITSAPAEPVITGNTTICQGAPASLSILNPQPGLTYRWYDAPSGGNLLIEGITYTPATVSATVTFYVQASNGNCNSAARTAVTLTVLPAPRVVTVDAANKTVCIGNSADLHVTNPQAGVIHRWFSTATGGTPLYTGTDYFTPPLTANATFFVEALNPNNCASISRTAVTVTVTNGTPLPVVAPEVTVCRGLRPSVPVTNPDASQQYRWYDAPAGGTLLYIGNPYIAADPLNGRDTVYVEASLAGGTCVSNGRSQVILVAADAPATPVLANGGAVTICSGTTATFNVQNPMPNTVYRWYDAAVNGNLLAENTGSYTTGPLTADMMVYVEAVIGGSCASTGRATATATVGTNPAAPVVNADAATVCPDSTATIRATSAQAGVVFRWYTTAAGGTPVFTGPVFVTPAITAATTYYVTAGFTGGCETATRVPVTIGVYAVLPAPVVSVALRTANSVTFTWTPVPGAIGYRVSTDNGITFTQPSSGLTGTTHVISNLQPNQNIALQVMAIGESECSNSAWFLGGGSTDNPAGNLIFVPNAFTPNNDGRNDVLFVYGTTIATLEMRVYNQWGQLVFETKDKGRGWDGTMSGKKQPVGVYNYVLRATLNDGTTVQKRGTITIVR